jgi:reverse gyrase
LGGINENILHALMKRVSALESEAKINEIEKMEMQQQLQQIQNDKETLEERVEILEALTVKSGKKS